MDRDLPTAIDSLKTLTKFLEALREEGLSPEALNWIIDDLEKRRFLALSWLALHPRISGRQRVVRQIMGANMIGPEEIMHYGHYQLTNKDWKNAEKIPWLDNVLQASADDHLLIFMPSMKIQQIYDLSRFMFHDLAPLYMEEDQKPGAPEARSGWFLVQKKPFLKDGTWTTQLGATEGTDDLRILPGPVLLFTMFMCWQIPRFREIFPKGTFFRTFSFYLENLEEDKTRRIAVGLDEEMQFKARIVPDDEHMPVMLAKIK